ncbi:MAG: RNA polymerase sigma factor [Phycisphaeraceae bacterium]|nr:MAG: RNA polymerase sigma factor [Phycisphaeraceae bacterium]
MGLPMGRIMTPADTREPDWADLSLKLRDMARALVGARGEDAADELAQRTIVRLMVKRPDRADHLGYARTTMVRLWLDEQRSAKRRLARMAVWARTAPTRTRDADRLDESERTERIRRRIERLPPTQRAALAMRIVGGMSSARIAEALNMSEAAARSALHVARSRLREELEAES